MADISDKSSKDEKLKSRVAIRSSSSPKPLVKLAEGLSPNNIKAIDKAGFGGLVRIKSTIMPHGLAQWLIKRYNSKTSDIVIIPDRIISVDAKSVNRILGLPATGAKVPFVLDPEAKTKIFEGYNCELNGFLPASKLYELMKMKENKDDNRFLVTFLLYVISTFLSANTGGRIKAQCCKVLLDLENISNYNWGQFVVDMLKIRERQDHKKVASGCIFFVTVLYLDSLNLGQVRIPDDVPRCAVWSTNLINQVVELDMKKEGVFGQRPLKLTIEPSMLLETKGEPFRLFKTNDEVMEFVHENIDKNNISKEKIKELHDAVEEFSNEVMSDMMRRHNEFVSDIMSDVKKRIAAFLQRLSTKIVQGNSSQEPRKAVELEEVAEKEAVTRPTKRYVLMNNKVYRRGPRKEEQRNSLSSKEEEEDKNRTAIEEEIRRAKDRLERIYDVHIIQKSKLSDEEIGQAIIVDIDDQTASEKAFIHTLEPSGWMNTTVLHF